MMSARAMMAKQAMKQKSQTARTSRTLGAALGDRMLWCDLRGQRGATCGNEREEESSRAPSFHFGPPVDGWYPDLGTAYGEVAT